MEWMVGDSSSELIYVSSEESKQKLLDLAARRADWLPAEVDSYPKASHVELVLVLGEDGKRFLTGSTETIKLVDLLDEPKSKCKATLIERGKSKEWTEVELDEIAEAIGYRAIKYADLKNKRTNYTFSFDQMLNDKFTRMEGSIDDSTT